MNGIAGELFAKGSDGRLILLLAGLALFVWIISEVTSVFVPKMAMLVKITGNLFAVFLVYKMARKILDTILG